MRILSKAKLLLLPFLAAILAVGLAIPAALAANPVIQNVTYSPDPFYHSIPTQTPVMTFVYSFNSGGAIQFLAPVIEQIKNEQNQVVYEWGSVGADNKLTSQYTLTWDGKYKTGGASDGQYVPDGKYKLYLYSETASLPAAEFTSPLFSVAKAVAPAISLISQPPSIYYTGNGGNYTINYQLTKGSGSVVAVRLRIKGPMNNNPVEYVVATNSNNADGNYTISWDGLLNNNTPAASEYSWSITPTASINAMSMDGNVLTGNFTVSNQSAPNPTLSTLTATPNPYDINDGGMTFSYMLNGSLGTTSINAAIYNVNDLNTTVKTWNFTNQASGTNSVSWDGKNASNTKVDEGSYIFKVWGNDGNFQIVPQQVGFTVEKGTTPPPAGNCAGFTDVQATSSDCDAITYVKSIGAMTGNPDGTFAPSDLLQRDQIAKIVLMTFNKFNTQSNYCAGVNPFPDVNENEWSYQYICRGKGLGMITGYQAGADAGYYRPARSVNRVEFLALLLRNLSDVMPGNGDFSYSDVPINQWYTGYAKYSYDHSLFTGTKLYPTNFTTRVQVAQVIYKLHELGKI
jgi:flagellar hook assembly protein FlgD